ncbi:META domain-containing protein [Halomonas sediminis]
MKSAYRIAPLAVLAAVILGLVGCSSTPDTQRLDEPSSQGLFGPVVEQRWNLLLVGTNERLSMPETPYFRIEANGKLSGHDGCNRFSGEVALGDNQRIEVSELATTRMACPQLEDAQRVTDMLETAYRYLIDHDRLVFFGPDSRVLGGFRKAG